MHAAGLTDDTRRFVLQWHDVTDDTERKGGLPDGGPLFCAGLAGNFLFRK